MDTLFGKLRLKSFYSIFRSFNFKDIAFLELFKVSNMKFQKAYYRINTFMPNYLYLKDFNNCEKDKILVMKNLNLCYIFQGKLIVLSLLTNQIIYVYEQDQIRGELSLFKLDNLNIALTNYESIKIFNLKDFNIRTELKHSSNPSIVSQFNKKLLIAGYEDSQILVWTISSNTHLILSGHEAPIKHMIKLNKETIVSVATDRKIIAWNVKTRKIISIIDYGGKYENISLTKIVKLLPTTCCISDDYNFKSIIVNPFSLSKKNLGKLDTSNSKIYRINKNCVGLNDDIKFCTYDLVKESVDVQFKRKQLILNVIGINSESYLIILPGTFDTYNINLRKINNKSFNTDLGFSKHPLKISNSQFLLYNTNGYVIYHLDKTSENLTKFKEFLFLKETDTKYNNISYKYSLTTSNELVIHDTLNPKKELFKLALSYFIKEVTFNILNDYLIYIIYSYSNSFEEIIINLDEKKVVFKSIENAKDYKSLTKYLKFGRNQMIRYKEKNDRIILYNYDRDNGSTELFVFEGYLNELHKIDSQNALMIFNGKILLWSLKAKSPVRYFDNQGNKEGYYLKLSRDYFAIDYQHSTYIFDIKDTKVIKIFDENDKISFEKFEEAKEIGKEINLYEMIKFENNNLVGEYKMRFLLEISK